MIDPSSEAVPPEPEPAGGRDRRQIFGSVAPSLNIFVAGLSLSIIAQMFIWSELLRKTPLSLRHASPAVFGQLIWTVVVGVGLALLLQALLKRRFSELMPGHWQLAATAPVMLGSLVFVGNLKPTESFSSESFVAGNAAQAIDHVYSPFITQLLVVCVLNVVLFAAILLTTREPLAWKLYGALYVLTILLQCVVGVAMSRSLTQVVGSSDPGEVLRDLRQMFDNLALLKLLVQSMNLAAFATAVVAATLDFRDRTPRDIYHYAGLLLIVIGAVKQWL